MRGPVRKALYWHPDNGDAICDLCPHHCRIHPSETGLCKVRNFTEDRELYSLSYGFFSSLASDPVEKKPLYHWKPGSMILSIGSIGCNMWCPFCQNWQIASGMEKLELTRIDPDDIVRIAKERNLSCVAFTYNEPMINYEFIADAAPILRKNDLDIILVTNGMICKTPLEGILPYINAVNVDLKSFSNEGYRYIGGDMETVKKNIKIFFNYGIHLELTHLVVTGFNDHESEFNDLVNWVASISPDIILHISRYFPAYKWLKPPTSIGLMNSFHDIATRKLNYVYKGNIDGAVKTFCKNCGKTILERKGYRTVLKNLTQNGNCSFCGTDNGIVI